MNRFNRLTAGSTVMVLLFCLSPPLTTIALAQPSTKLANALSDNKLNSKPDIKFTEGSSHQSSKNFQRFIDRLTGDRPNPRRGRIAGTRVEETPYAPSGQ